MADIDAAKLDFLKEISNIGIGHSATSLSKMIGDTVEIALPKIDLIPVEDILSGKSEDICAVQLGILGEVNGAIVIVFGDGTAFWLIDKMMGSPEGTTHSYDDNGRSAMKEFANILAGGFLTAMSDFTGYNLLPKLPQLFSGKGADLTEDVKRSINEEVKNILHVNTELCLNRKKLHAEIYLVLNDQSFEDMFKMMT